MWIAACEMQLEISRWICEDEVSFCSEADVGACYSLKTSGLPGTSDSNSTSPNHNGRTTQGSPPYFTLRYHPAFGCLQDGNWWNHEII